MSEAAGAAPRGLAAIALDLIEGTPVTARDLAAAQRLVADAVACMVGAQGAAEAQPIVRWARRQPAGALRDAWFLAALSNLLELDAMHVPSSVHPGTVIVPAALAVASEMGSDGRALLRAVLRGTEAAVRLGRSTGRTHRQRFQSTSTCAGFGAALACADLYGLSRNQALDAMANMASIAGGLWAFVDEACAGKQWHAGHAAHCAVLATQLARDGLSGPHGVLDNRRGFHAVLCEDAAPGELEAPATGWAVHEVAYKPWPSPRPTHATILAALQAREAAGGVAATAVNVRTFGFAVELCSREQVKTPHDARFSLHYLAWAALAEGRIGFDTFEPAALERIAAGMSRVSVLADPEMSAAYPARSGALVELVLTNGERITRCVEAAPGDPELPLTLEQERAKKQMLLGAGNERLSALVDELGSSGTPVRKLLSALFSPASFPF